MILAAAFQPNVTISQSYTAKLSSETLNWKYASVCPTFFRASPPSTLTMESTVCKFSLHTMPLKKRQEKEGFCGKIHVNIAVP